MPLITLQRRFALFGWRYGRILGRGGAWAGLCCWRRLSGSKGRNCPGLGVSKRQPSGRLCWGSAIGGACLRCRIGAGSAAACLREGLLPSAPAAAGCPRLSIELCQNKGRLLQVAGPLGLASTGLCSGRTCPPVRVPLSARPGQI